jgi:hypothetical protein
MWMIVKIKMELKNGKELNKMVDLIMILIQYIINTLNIKQNIII